MGSVDTLVTVPAVWWRAPTDVRRADSGWPVRVVRVVGVMGLRRVRNRGEDGVDDAGDGNAACGYGAVGMMAVRRVRMVWVCKVRTRGAALCAGPAARRVCVDARGVR